MKKLLIALFVSKVLVFIAINAIAQTNSSSKEVFKSKDGKLYIKATSITYTPVGEDLPQIDEPNLSINIDKSLPVAIQLDSINAQVKRYKLDAEKKAIQKDKIYADLKLNGFISRQEKEKEKEKKEKAEKEAIKVKQENFFKKEVKH